jgi:uncharacterized protein YeaO (DUF488 family)
MTAHTVPADAVRLKRAYDPVTPADGTRVLVDRLWPRGLRKAEAAVDLWLKDIAPSTGLRRWFGHDPARWPEFRRRYAEELQQHAAQIEQIRTLLRQGTVTLLYGARDGAHNNAVVVRDVLLGAAP